MGLIGSIFAGVKKENAATKAANTQAAGAENAQTLEQQNQQNALGFQNNVWQGTQANEQPYLNLGAQSANSLADYLKTPFSAPTLDQARNSPGYQFELQSGTDALDKSASKTGNLFSGTAATDLQKFGTGLADTTYGDVYNRALQTYMTNYNTLQGGAQLGEQAAGTTGQLGQQAAGNTANLNLIGGQQQAQQINNAAAARASGYVGKANAYGGMINDVNQQLMEAALMAAG